MFGARADEPGKARHGGGRAYGPPSLDNAVPSERRGTLVVNTRKIAALGAAGLIAGAIATAGCTPVATSAASPSPSATAAKTTKGAAHIVAYSINSDGPYFLAIVTGAVGDYGPGV